MLLLLALPSARAQMSMGPEEEEMLEAMGIKGQPMGRKNLKPQAEIFKKDLKFIHCNVCRQMVDISLGKATELLEKRFQFQKKRKHDSTEFDGEFAVQEYVEKIWCAACRPAPAQPRHRHRRLPGSSGRLARGLAPAQRLPTALRSRHLANPNPTLSLSLRVLRSNLNPNPNPNPNLDPATR